MPDVTLDTFFDRLATRDAGVYGVSNVNQLEHALQSEAQAAAAK